MTGVPEPSEPAAPLAHASGAAAGADMTTSAVESGPSRTVPISLLTLLGVSAVGAIVAVAFAAFRGTAAARSEVDGDRAYGYLVELCKIGPRIPGTEGMAKQRELLTKYFEGLG